VACPGSNLLNASISCLRTFLAPLQGAALVLTGTGGIARYAPLNPRLLSLSPSGTMEWVIGTSAAHSESLFWDMTLAQVGPFRESNDVLVSPRMEHNEHTGGSSFILPFATIAGMFLACTLVLIWLAGGR
jgi:hypothetical protein